MMLSARTLDHAIDYLTIRCHGEELAHCVNLRLMAIELATLRGRAMRAIRDDAKKAAQLKQDVAALYAEMGTLVKACPEALGRLHLDVQVRRVESAHGRKCKPLFLRRCAWDGLHHCTCRQYLTVGWCEHAIRANCVYHLTDQRGLMMAGPVRYRPSEDHSRWIRQNAKRVTSYETEDHFPASVLAREGLASTLRQGF